MLSLHIMAIIKELKGDTPIIGEGTYLAETATLIGTVQTGMDCSIWYGAVLRGDVGAIRIGDRVVDSSIRSKLDLMARDLRKISLN